jgi:transcriptional regulator with XRE-family HTH domain
MEIGNFIRQTRRAAGYTIYTAARQLGVGPTYLSHIETERNRPSAALVEKMAALYGWAQADTDTLLLQLGHVPTDVRQRLVAKPVLCDTVRQG